jgi:hypothetical protein
VAFIFSKNSVCKLDNSSGTPVDVSGYVDSVTFERVIAMLDVTVLGNASNNFITGLKDGDEATVNFLWDTTIETQINSLFGLSSSSTLEVAPEGTASGKRRVYGEVWVKKIGYPVKVGEKVLLPVTFQKTGDVTSTTY